MKVLIFLCSIIFAGEIESSDLPVEMNPQINQEPARAWRAPNYKDQNNILGYSEDSFKVPDELKDRVQFWVDIYTKYNDYQGVLHDSKYTELVYKVVDFSHIEKDPALTEGQKAKARKKLIKEEKHSLVEMFKKFKTLSSSEGLPPEEKNIWDKFSNIEEKNKFDEAGKNGRLRIQLGLKDRFENAIFYSGKYLEEMEGIFKEEGLPIELTRLPFVESSFNLKARSKTGASGIWQIMPYTGRKMMKVGVAVDERNDPLKATRVAARMLKFNYNQLYEWSLAVTAYNYGVAGIKRIVQKKQTGNLADIVGTKPARRFGFASSSFYSSFLAALIVEKEALKYFPNAKWGLPYKYVEVKNEKRLYFKDLVQVFDNNFELAWDMNPQLTKRAVKNIFSIPQGTILRIPDNKSDQFAIIQSKTPEHHEIASLGRSYQVLKGDTIYDISKIFQVSINKILDANDNLDPRKLRPGQVISVPVP